MSQVNTPDLMSPQGVSATSLITGNLNESANRAAQAAMNRARLQAEAELQDKKLKSEQDLAEKQLQATALEHTRYQDFQSKEAEKERAAQQARDADQHRFETEQQQNLFGHQDKLEQQHTNLKLTEMELLAKQARSASDISNKHFEELKALRKQKSDLEDQIAAAQAMGAKSQGYELNLKDFVNEMGEHINAGATKAKTIGTEIGSDAIRDSVKQTLVSQKSGVAGVAVDAAQRVGMGENPVGAVGAEIASRLVNHTLDFFGGEADFKHTPLNDMAVLGNTWAKNAAGRVSKLAINGASPSDVSAALSKFMGTAIIAQQGMAADGSVKNGDEQKMLADLEAATKQLHSVLPDSVVSGLISSVKSGPDLAAAARAEYKNAPGMKESEKKATYDTMRNFSRIADVYDLVKTRSTDSTVRGSDPDRKLTTFVPKMLKAYADSSFTKEDFWQNVKRDFPTMTKEDLESLRTKFVEAGDIPPTGKVNKMILDLQAKQKQTDESLDLMRLQTENEAVGQSATNQQQAVDLLRKQLGR